MAKTDKYTHERGHKLACDPCCNSLYNYDWPTRQIGLSARILHGNTFADAVASAENVLLS